jgi:hypothetical protein
VTSDPLFQKNMAGSWRNTGGGASNRH